MKLRFHWRLLEGGEAEAGLRGGLRHDAKKGLPDLDTGSPTVRQKIAGYLVMLGRLGVAGFRIDAAKHIQQVELDKILAIVDSTATGEGRPLPYFFLEVSSGSNESIAPAGLG